MRSGAKYGPVVTGKKWVCQNEFQTKITTTTIQGEDDHLAVISEGTKSPENVGSICSSLSHRECDESYIKELAHFKE
jgi:hypothetical protein